MFNRKKKKSILDSNLDSDESQNSFEKNLDSGDVFNQPEKPAMEPGSLFNQPEEKINLAPEPVAPKNHNDDLINKNLEIVNSKLDAIRLGLESINHRITNLERMMDDERKKGW